MGGGSKGRYLLRSAGPMGRTDPGRSLTPLLSLHLYDVILSGQRNDSRRRAAMAKRLCPVFRAEFVAC
jgi:hypothetical protein